MPEVSTTALQSLSDALGRLPRKRFAHLPTALDRCSNLEKKLGQFSLWVKRDDATGMALGGNKTRQLEYVLGYAIAQGYDSVIQGAASQSNHSRQLAAAGARLGLEVHLTPWQDARSKPVQGNYLLSHLYGAVLHPIPADASAIEAKAAVAEELRAKGRKPFVIGMGSREGLILAAVAYIGAFLEIVDQLGGKAPTYLFSASQGSTQAGLLAAAKILGTDTKVIGINPMGPTHEAYSPPEKIYEMAVEAAAMAGYTIDLASNEVVNLTDYVGEKYGVPSRAGLAALRTLAENEGIILDPVYSSKAFSGLMDYAAKGVFTANDRVVFVHTGGLPGLFAYSGELVEN